MIEETYLPLERGQLTVMRVRAAIVGGVILIAAIIVSLVLREIAHPFAVLIAPVIALLLLYPVLISPGRRYAAWGYRVDPDELHLKHGVWSQQETIVPLGRVQHIDVGQGAIERACGVTHLTLYTAGTAHSSVTLPGLTRQTAEALRDEIRNHIRQDLG